MNYRFFLLPLALVLAANICFPGSSQAGAAAAAGDVSATTSATFKATPEMLLGTWIVDLRPTPDAPAYLKKLVITSVAEGKLTGTFYDGSPLQAGRLNDTSGDFICFAFFTDPGEGAYNTSGRLVGPDRLEGMTLSTSRGFLLPWHAVREKAAPTSPAAPTTPAAPTRP